MSDNEALHSNESKETEPAAANNESNSNALPDEATTNANVQSAETETKTNNASAPEQLSGTVDNTVYLDPSASPPAAAADLTVDLTTLQGGTLDDNETTSDDENDDEMKRPTLHQWRGHQDSDDDDEDDDDDDDDEKDPYLDEWQCPTCTLIQHISSRICEACGTAAPTLTPWQENMITEWDNMGDCIFYDTIMDICNNRFDINLNNKDEFEEFMVKLESVGIQSDHSKSRAIVMLEMIIQQHANRSHNNLVENVPVSQENYNPAKVMKESALSEAVSLKQWMKHNEIWEENLFLVLVQMGCTEVPHGLYLIDSWWRFHDVVRQVRVMRKQNVKSKEAQQRLDRLCTKFEKLWRQETGFKLTSIKEADTPRHGATAPALPKNVFANSEKRRKETKRLKKVKKSFRRKKKQRRESKEEMERKGKALKTWMKKNQMWMLALYQELMKTPELEPYLADPEKLMLKQITESMFDEIVRKVRVERFSQLKDNKARKQCDKMLLKFEKIWRKSSGIKKTSLK